MTSLTLPDIAAQGNQQTLPLDWVGMCGIALPLLIEGRNVAAYADAGVSLDDGTSRGIHMSRLYLALETFEQQTLSLQLLHDTLGQFLASHAELSTRAYLRLTFDHLLKRPALISPLAGWKRYPVSLDARLENEMFHVELSVHIPYSSTCPCSAALARQLIQGQFDKDFADKPLTRDEVRQWLGSSAGIVATPHSQRSLAKLRVRLADGDIRLGELIDAAEAALGTAVQTAVKRADEQAFALANGQNLMFCEDAARRLHQALHRLDWVAGFNVRVEHAESLHAHDAVAESRHHWPTRG
ncbi:GTP cyclohydrolase FolE2 [Pseudomonas xantholysinigenes]|uniref:GTP cyclohydrolase FolE2 n=1 Tax=Pseudomonas xantholysinigenes TaxID=2745490 RepID=A0A9E6PY27_9PSED|nr:GTP cyclohydrolase FolE2 [Pseudomonas xantholysinigenes]QXI38486.1 GTP cyclohydrolase I FolE2 [Pseudomonas xantholysinigenes]